MKYSQSSSIATKFLNQFTINEESQFEIQDLYQIEGPFTVKSLSDHLRKLFDEAIWKYNDNRFIYGDPLKTLHFIWAKYNDGRNVDYLELLQERCNFASSNNFGVPKIGLISFLDMQKLKCVTKEAVEKHFEGSFQGDITVGDDLESFIERIQRGEFTESEPDISSNISIQFKLLNDTEERKLENEEQEFLRSFQFASPDISRADMLESKSKLKFAKFVCYRKTYPLDDY